MLNRIGALALLAVSSSLVACSSPSSAPPAPAVDGQVVRGALALSSYSLDNGVVIARTADGRSFFAPVLANGTFAVTIPAGASARLSIASSTRKNGYVTVSRILWPGLHKTWARLDGTTASIALGNVHPARLNGAQIQDHGGSYGSGSSGSGSSGSGSGGYTTGGSSGSGSDDNGSDQGGSGGGYTTGGSNGSHSGGGDDNGSNDHGGHGSHACGTSSSGSSCVEADDCESDGTPVCAGVGESESECDGGYYATSDDGDHGSDVACGDGGGGSGSSHESGDDDSSGSGGSYESGDDDNGGNAGGGYTSGGSNSGGGADGGSGGNANGGSANSGGSAGGNTGHTGTVPNGGSCTVCAECLSGLVCIASKCATRIP